MQESQNSARQVDDYYLWYELYLDGKNCKSYNINESCIIIYK